MESYRAFSNYWNSNWDAASFPEAHKWRLEHNAFPDKSWTEHWTMSIEWVVGMNVIYLFNVFAFKAVIMGYVRSIKAKLLKDEDVTAVLDKIEDQKEKCEKLDEFVDKALEKTTFHKSLAFLREKPSTFMVLYNLSCVLWAAWSLYLILDAFFTEYPNPTFYGNEIVYKHMPKSQFAVYIFYMSKFWEHIDTYSMVARLPRSERQISFLHVYHHVSISFFMWWIMNHSTSGDEYLPVACNSFIHVVMYGYYLASQACMYPAFNKDSLKNAVKAFRPLMTRMQLIQFATVFTQACLTLWYCTPPETGAFKHMTLLELFYMITMLIGFFDFFFKNYKKKGSKKSVPPVASEARGVMTRA